LIQLRQMIFAKNITKEEREILIKQYKKGPNTLIRARAQALVLSSEGVKTSSVARCVHYHTNTIRDWINEWNVRRLSSLFPRYNHNQNASKLTREQKEEIKEILHKSPEEGGLPSDFFKLTELKNHINTQFGVVYESDRSYHYLLKHIGFSWQLPSPFDINRDEKQIKKRMKEIKEEIEPFMKDNDWIVLCADETRINHDEEIKRAWLKKGQKTVIRVERNKTGQSYFGVLNQKTDKHYLIEIKWQNTENMIKALKEIKQKYKNKNICLIWDNAGWHKSKKLREKLKKGQSLENFHLINFPPYAPDKNPEEHVWKYGKEEIRNSHFETFEELKECFKKKLYGRKFDYKM
jgi:transposase